MAKAKKSEFIEEILADDLKLLLKRGIDQLKEVDEFSEKDTVKLEKLTRVYSILMSDLRESVKNGIFGDKSENELKALAEDSDD